MGERRRAVAAAAAVAVFAAAVGVIVLLGRTSPPAFPTLAQQPTPRVDGVVAYLAEDGDESPCVAVVDLADGSRDVWGCPDADVNAAAVAGDARTVRATGEHPGGWLVLTYDADGLVSRRVVAGPGMAPGEPPATEPTPAPGALPAPHGARRPDGARAVTGFGDERGEVTVLAGDGRVTARRDLDGGDYAITQARWTGDGRWLLLWDTAGRLLVASEQLSDVRVVADDVAVP